MAPEQLRNYRGFIGSSVGCFTLLCASPAVAQGLNATSLMGAAPLTIALGAGGFALLAMAALRRLLRDGKAAQLRAGEQIAGLRALVDEYEALLSGSREMIILWTDHTGGPKFLGQHATLLPPGRRPEAILDFSAWLPEPAAEELGKAVDALKLRGQSFDLGLRGRDGRLIRTSGWALGSGAAMRIRPASTQPAATAPDQVRPVPIDLSQVRAVLASLPMPAFLRDGTGKLSFANPAYHELAQALGRHTSAALPAEIIESGVLRRHRVLIDTERKPQASKVAIGSEGTFQLVELPLSQGSAGYLHRQEEAPADDLDLGHLSSIIDALAIPIAIFNARRELVQFNRAYLQLWELDPSWLRHGIDERSILDKLRTEGRLPNEPDYHAWRARHLTSYQLQGPRDNERWHLPDGRTVQVIAAPAGPLGGVIYVFEDITDQLNLKSQHQALLDVQRGTLNALSEGVAVFGTNGRLTLFNPRLSMIWKLPTNLLAANPHIDQVAESAATALPEDGATIWRDLKRSIIDLNPTRSDQQGRIARADGKLVDYAIVRLPDGQTMMTFLDVTESANYQRVLKERNEALITADRLKDAFVQNVSYELRSPLTNIIGFADLLASGSVGALNEKQRTYTEYIRASSVTLGVLIDNILDLATVDAGIAELRPELQDVEALVEKARAGLAATFPEIDGERSINLRIEVQPDLPPFIADGTRIVQVLYNLLSSAARFSEPGGEVKLSILSRGERMLFLVEDEGTAMSEEMRAALQDRTDQPSISGRQRGAGLGLAIVRTFVNLHGGTISVERREPRGSRVVVNLPRDVALAGVAE